MNPYQFLLISICLHNFLAQKVAFPSLKSHWTAGLGGSGLPNQSFSVYNIILAIINSILTI